MITNRVLVVILYFSLSFQGCAQQSPQDQGSRTDNPAPKGILDYSKLGQQNPCEFFDIEEIVGKYNLDGTLDYQMTPGNSAELPHCEVHWQIGDDSLRIIRTFVFQYEPTKEFMHVAWKNCRSDREGQYNGHLIENIITQNEKDCGLYGKHNWGGVSVHVDGAINYIYVEFEYRNKQPISPEEHELRKELGTEIAERLAERLK